MSRWRAAALCAVLLLVSSASRAQVGGDLQLPGGPLEPGPLTAAELNAKFNALTEWLNSGPLQFPIGELPACTAGREGARRVVTDALDASTCTTAGGSALNTCECQDAAWVLSGSGVGGGGGGDVLKTDFKVVTGSSSANDCPAGTFNGQVCLDADGVDPDELGTDVLFIWNGGWQRIGGPGYFANGTVGVLDCPNAPWTGYICVDLDGADGNSAVDILISSSAGAAWAPIVTLHSEIDTFAELDALVADSTLVRRDSGDPWTVNRYVIVDGSGNLASVVGPSASGDTTEYLSLAASQSLVEGRIPTVDGAGNFVISPRGTFTLGAGIVGNPSWETTSGQCWDFADWDGAGWPDASLACTDKGTYLQAGFNTTLRRLELWQQEPGAIDSTYGCFFYGQASETPISRSATGTATGGDVNTLIDSGANFAGLVASEVLIVNASDTASGSEMGWLRAIDSVTGGNTEINFAPDLPEAVVSGDAYHIFPRGTVCQLSASPVDGVAGAQITAIGDVCSIPYAEDVNGSTSGTPTGLQVKMVASSLGDGCAAATCVCDAGTPDLGWRALANER